MLGSVAMASSMGRVTLASTRRRVGARVGGRDDRLREVDVRGDGDAEAGVGEEAEQAQRDRHAGDDQRIAQRELGNAHGSVGTGGQRGGNALGLRHDQVAFAQVRHVGSGDQLPVRNSAQDLHESERSGYRPAQVSRGRGCRRRASPAPVEAWTAGRCAAPPGRPGATRSRSRRSPTYPRAARRPDRWAGCGRPRCAFSSPRSAARS